MANWRALQHSLVVVVTLAVWSPAFGAEYDAQGLLTLDRLVNCQYNQTSGVFLGEGLWQTANTLETSANFAFKISSPQLVNIIQNSFAKTQPFMDHCYDDFQWWLHAWMRSYGIWRSMEPVQRAAQIFDYVATMWSPVCGGGLIWCPKTTYKNAITNELFLVSAMYLHPFATRLGKPATYYLDWALKEWAWFESSGMINGDMLINDGLTETCKNNGQPTWTYNQGVILTGLALLSSATDNATLIAIGESLLRASMQSLTVNGILHEPCEQGGCGGDGPLFKGIYMRHARYFMSFSKNATLLDEFDRFQVLNAESILDNDTCSLDDYGVIWSGPCKDPGTAATSAAADAFYGAAFTTIPCKYPAFRPYPVPGHCSDSAGQLMSACRKDNVTRADCQTTVTAIKGVAFDYELSCDQSVSVCRVRTLQGAASCPPSWAFEPGPATTITATMPANLTGCYWPCTA